MKLHFCFLLIFKKAYSKFYLSEFDIFYYNWTKKDGFIFIHLSLNERITEKPQFPCQNSSIDFMQVSYQYSYDLAN